MIVSDLHLLEIDILDKDDNVIYSGMSEDVPEELLKKRIRVVRNESRKIICKLENT